LLGVSNGVYAAAGDIVVTVTPISTGSTYSRPSSNSNDTGSVAILGFTVLVESISGNTINSVNFEGATEVKTLNGELATGKTAPYLFAEYTDSKTKCSSVSTNPVAVTCALGQYRAGEKRTFKLYFAAPQEALIPNEVPPTVNAFLTGRVLHAEGPNGGNSQNNSISYWADVSVQIGEATGKGLKSLVKKDGSKFFTGYNGVPGYSFPDEFGNLKKDEFASTITVPSAAVITSAAVNEDPYTCGSTNFRSCYRVNLQIVDPSDNKTFNFSPNYLSFLLRMDSSNILTNNIRSVTLIYKYTNANGEEATHIVGDCASPKTPRADGLPCIAATKDYKSVKRTDDPSLLGVFEWLLISYKNGIMEFE
jgi:hypothetical protein